MKTKGLSLSVLFIGLMCCFQPCSGQVGQTKDVYKSIRFSYVKSMSYNVWGWYTEGEYDNIKPDFSFELGYNYSFRIHKQLYFRTGVAIESLNYSGTTKDYGLWSEYDEYYLKDVYKRSYSNNHLKVPLELCLMLPIGEKAVFSPYLGLGVCAMAYSYNQSVNEDVVPRTSKKYYDYEEDNESAKGVSIAAMAPQLGVSLLIEDKLLLGLGYEMMWAGGESMNDSANLLFSVGVSF